MSRTLLERLRGSGSGAVLARGSLGSFTVKAAGLVIALLPQLLLTRLMGASSYGIYTVALNWVWVLLVLAKFGQDTTRVRFLAAYRAAGDWSSFRGLLRWSSWTVLAVSLIIGLALAAIVLSFGGRIGGELRAALLAGCLLLPVLALVSLNAAALQSLRKVVAAETPRLLNHVLLVALALAALLLPGFIFSGAVVILLTTLANLGALAVGWAILRRGIPAAGHLATPVLHTRLWLGVGLGMLAVSGQFLIMNRVDILMLKFFVPAADVGVYGIAVRVAALVPFGLDAVSMIAAPMVSELWSAKKKEELRRVVHLAVSWSALISFGIFAIVALAGKHLLGMFGPEFPGGYIPLVILGAGQLFNALTGPSGLLLTMTGRERQLAGLLSLALLLNAALNWMLIPVWGVVGAAAATSCVTVLWNAVAVVVIRRQLGIFCVLGLSGLKPKE